MSENDPELLPMMSPLSYLLRQCFLAISLFLIFSTETQGTPQPGDVLKASNPDPADRYGHAVASSGDTLVVGAPGESSAASGVNPSNISDNSAPSSGAVYVLIRGVGGTWSQQAILKAASPQSGDRFGIAVAVLGDVIVVGADGDDEGVQNSGAAYVFVRVGANWTQVAKLKAASPGEGDGFGLSVAVSGQTLVVGAPAEDGGATGVNGGVSEGQEDSGAAYVFAPAGTGWTQTAYLKASNTGLGDAFGWSVSATHGTILVGAPWEDGGSVLVPNNPASLSGAAYVFVPTAGTWAQQRYLKASSLQPGQAYGMAVAAAAETVAVGAPFDLLNGSGTAATGAAYLLLRTGQTWAEQARVIAANADSGDEFGASIALMGDIVLVGAPGEDSPGTGVNSTSQADNNAEQSGAAYNFSRSGAIWGQQNYLKASNTDMGDRFGESVAVFAEQVVVGAPGEASSGPGVNPGGLASNTGIDSGATYTFTAAPPFTIAQRWRQQWFGTSHSVGVATEGFDADGDGVLNLIEFGFGTNPTNAQSGPHAVRVAGGVLTQTGSQVAVPLVGGSGFAAMFTRRKDWLPAGLTYQVLFSSDLITWTTSSATPTLVASDSELEVVTVPYPPLVNGTKAQFFKVVIELAP